MINQIDKWEEVQIKEILDSPYDTETIISACDKLISSLNEAKSNALEIRIY